MTRNRNNATFRHPYVREPQSNSLDLNFELGLMTAEMPVYATSGADVLTNDLAEGATLHWISLRWEEEMTADAYF